jgi:cell division protein FtsZ
MVLGQEQANHYTKDTIRIKVMGVGGGGNNAVNQMIKSKIEGAEYFLVNTEKSVLDRANPKYCTTIQIGKETTNGLGAGADPIIGERAAHENLAEIDQCLEDTDLLFLTAGMGGGTGTGALPVIAEEARKLGTTTIAIVTKPFSFEGKLRKVRAEVGIERLKPNVSSLIVIDNNKLLETSTQETTIIDAFKMTDDVLRQAVQSITDLVFSIGTINVDFADIKTIFSYEGFAYMGIGEAKGENKIEEATMDALKNPLTESTINDAKGVIFNIKGGEDIGLDDINRSASIIAEKVNPEATVIFGTNIEKELGSKVIVTVVATGVEQKKEEER